MFSYVKGPGVSLACNWGSVLFLVVQESVLYVQQCESR